MKNIDMPISIVIVDDHLLVAKALTTMIEQFNGFKVLYEAVNGKVLMEKIDVKKNIPDIVLLDISMPVMDGVETANWLKENHPSVKIIALTGDSYNKSFIKMIHAGAVSYLEKNAYPEELEKTLNIVFNEGIYYPHWASSVLVDELIKGKKGKIKLTDRERIFLSHCCTELNYKEIAELMCLSPRTIEGYRDSLFEKLNVRTRVALALYAVRIGLYKLDLD